MPSPFAQPLQGRIPSVHGQKRHPAPARLSLEGGSVQGPTCEAPCGGALSNILTAELSRQRLPSGASYRQRELFLTRLSLLFWADGPFGCALEFDVPGKARRSRHGSPSAVGLAPVRVRAQCRVAIGATRLVPMRTQPVSACLQNPYRRRSKRVGQLLDRTRGEGLSRASGNYKLTILKMRVPDCAKTRSIRL